VKAKDVLWPKENAMKKRQYRGKPIEEAWLAYGLPELRRIATGDYILR
jgi:hypothetical protein